MPKRIDMTSVAWRTGAINPTGGRNFIERTKTYKFRTMGRLEGTANAQSDYVNAHYFPVTCLNDPMGDVDTNIGFTVDADNENKTRHPQFHDTAIADNFEVYQVLSSDYYINVQVQSADSNDVVLAWCFQRAAADNTPTVSNPLVHLTHANTQTEALKDDLWYSVRNNGGWAYARFSGTQTGGSPYPSQGQIHIPIRSVFKLGMGLWAQYGDGTTEIGNEILDDKDSAFKGILSNTSSATNGEVGRYFLCLYMFKAGPSSSQVLGEDRISLEITIDQKAKLWRNTASSVVAGTLFDNVSKHA